MLYKLTQNADREEYLIHSLGLTLSSIDPRSSFKLWFWIMGDIMTRRVGVSGWVNGVVVETPGAGWGTGVWSWQLVSGCLPPGLSQPQLRARAGSGVTVECEWGVPGAVWGQLWASWINKPGPSRLDFDIQQSPNFRLKVKQLGIYSWLEPFHVIALFIEPHITVNKPIESHCCNKLDRCTVLNQHYIIILLLF